LGVAEPVGEPDHHLTRSQEPEVGPPVVGVCSEGVDAQEDVSGEGVGTGPDRRTLFAVRSIGEPGRLTCPGLDDRPHPGFGQRRQHGRNERHPGLARERLGGDADRELPILGHQSISFEGPTAALCRYMGSLVADCARHCGHRALRRPAGTVSMLSDLGATGDVGPVAGR
jgi:hypothetical protein